MKLPTQERKTSMSIPASSQVFEARNLGRYRLKRRIATGGMARLELLDLDHLEVEGTSDGVDEAVSKRQLGAAVADAIEHLPPKLQQVLALYYQEDCTLREIGSVLGLTESRISQLHSEAMHRLRALIGRR